MRDRLNKSLGSCPSNRGKSSSFSIMADMMSIFDASTFTKVDSRFLVWVSRFFYLLILVGVVYWHLVGRLEAVFDVLVGMPLGIVRRSKLKVFGGSYLMIVCLFIILIGVDIVGLLPYSFSVRSHLVFRISFGLSFWVRLVLSRLVLGRLRTSIAKLIFCGVVVVGGVFLCWMERFSVFLRWITLSIRLVANIRVGQIVSVLLGNLVVVYYFGFRSMVYFFFLLLRGVCVLVAEAVVGFVQAYLFCLLLTVYGNDHSI